MPDPELTREQLDALLAKLRPQLGYLNRLVTRMSAVGFTVEDRQLKLVMEARDAMHELVTALHCYTCRGQTGGPSTTGDASDGQ